MEHLHLISHNVALPKTTRTPAVVIVCRCGIHAPGETTKEPKLRHLAREHELEAADAGCHPACHGIRSPLAAGAAISCKVSRH